MEIILNGEIIEVKNTMNINELLQSQGYKNKMVAVAINGSFVPKSSYEAHIINNKDDIEIVAPMQGG